MGRQGGKKGRTWEALGLAAGERERKAKGRRGGRKAKRKD